MDCFSTQGEHMDHVRARLLVELPDALQGAEQIARDAELGIDDMFGGAAEPRRVAEPRPVRPLTLQERLDGEKEVLGLYFTGHPVEQYLDEIRRFRTQQIRKLRVGQDVQTVAGVVVSHRTRRGRRGEMAFTSLDDGSGRIEASIFGDVFQQNRKKLEKDAILLIEGEVQASDYAGGAELKLRANRIMTLAEARNRHARCVLRIGGNGDADGFATDLKRILGQHRNEAGCAVMVEYESADANGRVALGNAWRVDGSDALLGQLRDRFGADAVHLHYESSAAA